jgi:hypothetical protein
MVIDFDEIVTPRHSIFVGRRRHTPLYLTNPLSRAVFHHEPLRLDGGLNERNKALA